MTPREAVIGLHEWYELFSKRGFGDKKVIKEFLEIANLIETLEKQVPRWISVEDEQKPLHGHDYLCVCTLPNDPEHKFDFISVRWWNATTGNSYVDRPHFSDEGFEGMTVTHWMPLPELPKDMTP